LFIAWWDRTLDTDRARRVFAGETVEPLPGTAQQQPDGATDLDDELSEFSRHELDEAGPRHAGQADAATPARDRTPAYSETV
jgi:aerobic C4-dicarboxylate transport protein